MFNKQNPVSAITTCCSWYLYSTLIFSSSWISECYLCLPCFLILARRNYLSGNHCPDHWRRQPQLTKSHFQSENLWIPYLILSNKLQLKKPLLGRKSLPPSFLVPCSWLYSLNVCMHVYIHVHVSSGRVKMRPQWLVHSISDILCLTPLSLLPYSCGTAIVLSSVLALKSPSTLAGVASWQRFTIKYAQTLI